MPCLRLRSWIVVSVLSGVLAVACGQHNPSYSPAGPTRLAARGAPEAVDDSGVVLPRVSDGNESRTLLRRGNKGRRGDAGDCTDADKSSPGRGNKVSGFVTSVGTETLVVRGVTVKLIADTIIRHGNRRLAIDDIDVGNHVQARGMLDGTTLVASEVKVEPNGNHDRDAGDDDEDEDDD